MRLSKGRIRLMTSAACSTGEAVSLRPSDWVKGGAVIDDVDIEIVSARSCIYDFPTADGRTSPPMVCVHLGLKTEDGEVHDEYLKAGDPKFFAPSNDERSIVTVGEKGALIENTKYALFIVSLVNLGFPESQIKNEVDYVVGTKCHIKRQAEASWSGLAKREGQRDATKLVATVLHAIPGVKAGKQTGVRGKPAASKAGGVAAAPGAAAQPSKANGAGDSLDAEIVPLVQQCVAEAGGTISKKDLLQAMFKAASGPNKKQIVQRSWQDDFLLTGMAEGAWEFDGDEVKAVAAD